jgi:hypothetical protein
MASRDEIVDQIAGFALFADLTTPQLERIAHMFEEEVHPAGTRVLRQGLSGSAFHVILDGEAEVIIDGPQRLDPRPRRLLRRGLDPPRRGARRRHRRHARAADARPGRPAGPRVLAQQPAADVPDAPGAGAPPAEREPVAELSRPGHASRRRPSHPATTRSSSSAAGPGAIQVSYALGRLGIEQP